MVKYEYDVIHSDEFVTIKLINSSKDVIVSYNIEHDKYRVMVDDGVLVALALKFNGVDYCDDSNAKYSFYLLLLSYYCC